MLLSCVYALLLTLTGDLSMEELMAKYGYVSQEVNEDVSDPSDEESGCSLCALAVTCTVCVCVCV